MRILILFLLSMPAWSAYHVEWVVFESGIGDEAIQDLALSDKVGELSSYVEELQRGGSYKVLDHQTSAIEGDYFSMLKNYQLEAGENFALDMKGPLKGDHWRFSVQGDIEGFTKRAIDDGSLFRKEYYDEPFKRSTNWKERVEPDKVYLFDHDKVNVLLMVYETEDPLVQGQEVLQ